MQQCNCVTKKALGLSKAIAEKFPHADFYSRRQHPSKPGTVEVRGNGKDERWVCALYGQYYPGKPSNRTVNGNFVDSAEQREEWFQDGLDKIAKIKNLRSIAFPYHVGCGLAGGDWRHYETMLINFEQTINKQRLDASIPLLKVYIINLGDEPLTTTSLDQQNWGNTTLLEFTTNYYPQRGWAPFFINAVKRSLPVISSKLETDSGPIYPPLHLVYSAFYGSDVENIKVIIIGQDPYHGEGQANGIAFAVPPDVKNPPSLTNIYKEMRNDDIKLSTKPNFSNLLKKGVFPINTALTVRAGAAASHSSIWQNSFTPALMKYLNDQCNHLIIIMWGNHAKSFDKYFDKRHYKIYSVHPSPLSAHNGFFDSHPFSLVNKHLLDSGDEPIDWAI